MRISIIDTVANLCFIYKFIVVNIPVSLKAITVYQVTKIPGWCSSQSTDTIELMLRKLRTTCAEERHVLIRSWELSMRPAPVNTLWKRLVNCTPKISAVLGPWFPWSLLRAVRCEGGKGWPVLVLSPTQPVGAGSPRAQPLAAQILQHQQTSSQGDCFFIKLFNSSNFLVYKINTSGYTRYVTFYDDTSSTTIRCFY